MDLKVPKRERKRRSRLEMKADILRSLERGDLNRYEISNLQNIYSTTVNELLAEMKKNGLVSRDNRSFSIMPAGKELLKMLAIVEEKLG
ncbi:winged helix-turn-helix domain-containing protein [Candidatus Pacearchaeota archaeon]|jgi:predicted transcriptional regulator|nr:winged helix-turn-helix domain-containing protein [Candidatus Pacearchaeota archaeon]